MKPLILATLLTITIGVVFGACPSSEWEKKKRECYYFSPGTASWPAANDACIAMGSHLASIHSEEEHLYLMKKSPEGSWIGLSRTNPGSANPFTWTDGSPVDYVNWAGGQPDDWRGEEACAHQRTTTGFWNDLGCSQGRRFICKISNRKKLKAKVCRSRGVKHTAGEVWVEENNGRKKECRCPNPVPDKWSKRQNCKRVTVVTGSCPSSEWKENDGKCYYFSPGTASWPGAKDACEAKGAQLASIHSEAEHKYLMTTSPEGSWIGLSLTNIGSTNPYSWTDGSPVDYLNWAGGQPDNWGGVELCVHQRTTTGFWNDLPCNQGRTFVCKADKN